MLPFLHAKDCVWLSDIFLLKSICGVSTSISTFMTGSNGNNMTITEMGGKQ